MANPESVLTGKILRAVGAMPGVALWRNTRGVHKEGERVIKYGLTDGAADLIGMVDGRFCALEVKTTRGRTTENQELFLGAVRINGGFGAVIRSVEDAKAAISRCRLGANL